MVQASFFKRRAKNQVASEKDSIASKIDHKNEQEYFFRKGRKYGFIKMRKST